MKGNYICIIICDFTYIPYHVHNYVGKTLANSTEVSLSMNVATSLLYQQYTFVHTYVRMYVCSYVSKGICVFNVANVFL